MRSGRETGNKDLTALGGTGGFGAGWGMWWMRPLLNVESPGGISGFGEAGNLIDGNTAYIGGAVFGGAILIYGDVASIQPATLTIDSSSFIPNVSENLVLDRSQSPGVGFDPKPNFQIRWV